MMDLSSLMQMFGTNPGAVAPPMARRPGGVMPGNPGNQPMPAHPGMWGGQPPSFIDGLMPGTGGGTQQPPIGGQLPPFNPAGDSGFSLPPGFQLPGGTPIHALPGDPAASGPPDNSIPGLDTVNPGNPGPGAGQPRARDPGFSLQPGQMPRMPNPVGVGQPRPQPMPRTPGASGGATGSILGQTARPFGTGTLKPMPRGGL